MSELDRHQKPRPEAIRDIRRLLLTPNPTPRYPRSVPDIAEYPGNRKVLRSRLRNER